MKRSHPEGEDPNRKSQKAEFDAVDKGYFDAYADLAIHETMLRDQVRTLAYKNAIIQSKSLIQGKVVLDVGGGTGILSIFAAKEGGAKKVYCVDASDIADHAKKIVEHNGLSHVIQVIKGKMEEIELPEKVDVIISEWMGYFLVFESMLESVLYARDKWLKPGGLLLPARAKLYLSILNSDELYEPRINFWKEVKDLYGVDMSILVPTAKQEIVKEVLVDFIPQEAVMADPDLLLDLDLSKTTTDELKSLKKTFTCKSFLHGLLHGFVSWFDVFFDVPNGKPIILSTSPHQPGTHWKQVMFFVNETPLLNQDQEVHGEILVTKNARNNRCLNVTISYQSAGMEKRVVNDYVISDNPYLDNNKSLFQNQDGIS